MNAYQQFAERWKNCTACPLCERRQRVVLGRGSYPCDVCFIGEAPGPSENVVGKPFVGPAGKLLDHIISKAVPKEVTYALTNLVCCIPLDEDGNKATQPEDDHIESCKPRLQQFIEIVDPKVIVCVGKLATDWLDPGYRHSITFHKSIPIADIVHPAYILRANVSQQGLAIQRAVVTIQDAIDQYVLT